MSASPQELNLLDLLDALTKDRIQAWAEALLLTFNFEASFFEGRVLGRLRALGAPTDPCGSQSPRHKHWLRTWASGSDAGHRQRSSYVVQRVATPIARSLR